MRKQKTVSNVRRSSGLMAPASQVAAAPARAVTSHIRRIYRDKYAGRHRFARWVFAFDAFILVVLGTLLVFDLVVFFRGIQTADPGLEVTLATPELRSADVVPLEVKVRVTDARQHTGVKVALHLPQEMSLIQAWPALDRDGMWTIGSLSPGETATRRVLVHLDATINTRVDIGFVLQQYDPIIFEQALVGTDSRPVTSSALRLMSLVPVAGVSEGAQIPIVIENRSAATSSPMNVILTDSSGAPHATLGSDGIYSLPALPANSQKIVFLSVGTGLESERLGFRLELQSGGRKVDQLELDLMRETRMPAVVTAPQTSDSGAGTIVRYSGAQPGARLILLQKEITAFGRSAFETVDLPEGSGAVDISQVQGVIEGQLMLVSIFDGDYYHLSGQMLELASASLPFEVQARYYTASGDQLGLGPLPPVAGEPTRYWILWTLGPADRSLHDLTYDAQLADNVKATGKYASTIPISFASSDSAVKMTVEEADLAGLGKITFGYEVELVPQKNQEGLYANILLGSSIDATDEFGEHVQAVSPSIDTDLSNDEKARGKGTVQE